MLWANLVYFYQFHKIDIIIYFTINGTKNLYSFVLCPKLSLILKKDSKVSTTDVIVLSSSEILRTVFGKEATIIENWRNHLLIVFKKFFISPHTKFYHTVCLTYTKLIFINRLMWQPEDIITDKKAKITF